MFKRPWFRAFVCGISVTSFYEYHRIYQVNWSILQTECTAHWLQEHSLQFKVKNAWIYTSFLSYTFMSTSNIEILERFQAKALRVITDAPWYISNAMLHRELRVSTVKHTVKNFSITYHRRIAQHPNLLKPPLIQGPSYPRRLKRKYPLDLPTTG